MDRNTKRYWVWALAILALLFISVALSLPGVAALSSTATQTSASSTAATAGTFDEHQAAYALQTLVIEVYDIASPAVVNVTNRSYVYYRFMGAVPEEGTGSGFVYDDDGHIVTNYHVIENAEELLVTLASG